MKDIYIEAVAMAVRAIPEGLLVVVTITHAIDVSCMVRRRAIIHKLPAMETLERTTGDSKDHLHYRNGSIDRE